LEKGEGLIFASFPHKVSRALQPQRHRHNVVFNLVLRKGGKWGTIAGIRSSRAARAANARHGSGHRNPLYESRTAAGHVYRAALRQALEERGIRTRDGASFGFEIADVPQGVIEHFSRRRREVLRAYRELRDAHGDRVPERKLLQWAAHSSRDDKPN